MGPGFQVGLICREAVGPSSFIFWLHFAAAVRVKGRDCSISAKGLFAVLTVIKTGFQPISPVQQSGSTRRGYPPANRSLEQFNRNKS
jgi:hypothetical protein